MAAERISKFHEDCEKLAAEGTTARIVTEVQRLRTWLQKHQDELVPNGAKLQLTGLVQKYYQTAQRLAAPTVTNAVVALIEDLLKLPEGKLIASKTKQQALKWLDALAPGKPTGPPSLAHGSTEETWALGDVAEDGTLQLVSVDGQNDEVLDGAVATTPALLAEIRSQWDAEGHCAVRVTRSTAGVLVTAIHH